MILNKSIDSQGNVYWGRDRQIMGYSPSTGQVSIIFDGNNGDIARVGGITVLKDEIYYSDRIKKQLVNYFGMVALMSLLL